MWLGGSGWVVPLQSWRAQEASRQRRKANKNETGASVGGVACWQTDFFAQTDRQTEGPMLRREPGPFQVGEADTSPHSPLPLTVARHEQHSR